MGAEWLEPRSHGWEAGGGHVHRGPGDTATMGGCWWLCRMKWAAERLCECSRKPLSSPFSRPISLGPFLGPQSAKTADFGGQGRTNDTPPSQRKTPGKIAVSADFPELAGLGKKWSRGGSNP